MTKMTAAGTKERVGIRITSPIMFSVYQRYSLKDRQLCGSDIKNTTYVSSEFFGARIYETAAKNAISIYLQWQKYTYTSNGNNQGRHH